MTADIIIRKAMPEEADRLGDIAYEAWERGILPLLTEEPGMRTSERRRLSIAVHEMLERILVAEVESVAAGWCSRAGNYLAFPSSLTIAPAERRARSYANAAR